jgi:hypothetical protein
MGDGCPLSGKSIAMSQPSLHKFISGDEELTPRRLLEFLGIALLLVLAMFVIASFLMLPVPV